MRQYEIRWAVLPQPVGRRPVLLLSRTPAFAYLAKVLVVPVTTRIRGIPQEVALGAREGLERASVASLDSLQVVPTASIGDRIGALAGHRQADVKRALGHALDWPELAGR